MACVNPNPGPAGKKYIFRYEYLLIETGTKMLRMVFDHKVGQDFKVYLDNNPDREKDFKKLVSRKILTPVQLQLLPPNDNSPSSDNFDITLLSCLMRNTCGLCSSTDQVWSTPQSTDTRLEADITRLRICRNELAHSGSVLENETVLNTKWKDLCSILKRLGSLCRFSKINALIQEAEMKEIDENLQEKFENIKKEWRCELGEMRLEVKSDIEEVKSTVKSDIEEVKSTVKSDIKEVKSTVKSDIEEVKSTVKSDIEEVKSTVKSDIKEVKSTVKSDIEEVKSTVKSDIEEVKSTVKSDIKEVKSTVESDIEEVKSTVKSDIEEVKSTVKSTVRSEIRAVKRNRRHDEDNEYKADIQKELIDAYQNDICSSLPLCSLLEDEKGGLLELYEVPTMYVVNYHKVEEQQTDKSSDNLEEVKTCSDLFHVKDKDCKNIYLTGDAGVGKTSFCKFLSLLWCKSKWAENTEVSNTSLCNFFSLLCCKSKVGKKLEKVDMQEYIDYLARFEFVFYVNLRDTHFTDVVAIIVNQLFFSENTDKSKIMYDSVEESLGNHDSLVIMDGLDEWTPKPIDKRRYEIPVRPKSLRCVYLTTCRPYKLENVRLSETNLDHQVKMIGLGKKEIKSYVSNLINVINTKYDVNKNKNEFMMAVKEVNLEDMLHIPMTTSHLVMLWFDRPLTSMSKSLIYGNIMDMLFKLAQKKGIDIQQANHSELKLPERLSELKHFKDHFSQIEQLCLLSFKLLFEHDTDITSHIFTRDQLASEPYCLSEEETNFFCTIGILSKSKVKREIGKQEHKLSFLHKSYLEFFAAIYVSTLDTSDVLELFSQGRITCINDVLKYKNFLIFYAGLSIDNLVSLMTEIYSLISTDLDLKRELLTFSSYGSTRGQLCSLQDLILKCYIDGSYQIGNSLPLEHFIFTRNNPTETDFVFGDEEITGNTKTKYLRKLILSNINKVRLLSIDGEYFDEFDHILSLTGLCIQSYFKCYREFNKLIKQNKSSLQIIHISNLGEFVSTPFLPLDDFQCLTSLSLELSRISHENIQYLTKFLSNNSQLKHVRLLDLKCTEQRCMAEDLCGSLELLQCNKLVYLEIKDTRIECTNINTSSLEYLKLETYPLTKSFARSYTNIFNSIQYALELKHIYIFSCDMLADYLVDTLITNVQYLSKIESIQLSCITITDNVSFLLHPYVKQISIRLISVNMTARWFHTFIKSVINKHCCIRLELMCCNIRQDNGDTEGDMSGTESVDYIDDYIKSISAIKIVHYDRTTFSNIELVINDNQ